MEMSEARERQAGMVAEGESGSLDEAAHDLVDSGEIDSIQHEELLSPAERERIYG